MKYPKLTRTRAITIMLGLLVLWIWYPSQRDPTPVSETPCWDINNLQERVAADHDIELNPYSCGPTGRFDWQHLVP